MGNEIKSGNIKDLNTMGGNYRQFAREITVAYKHMKIKAKPKNYITGLNA